MSNKITCADINDFFSEIGLQKPKQPDLHLLSEQEPHPFYDVLPNKADGIDAVVIWWEAGSSLIVSDVRARRSLNEEEVGRLLRRVTHRAKQIFVHKSYVEAGVDSYLINSLKDRGFLLRT